jgi:uncharacterized protein YjbI with pentapeptide repeats
MKTRRKPSVSRKPDDFPTENVLTGYDVPRLLAAGREFDRFRFVGCDLGGAELGGLRFEDCLFERCNLAGASLRDTALQNVAFADCKLVGVVFSACAEMLFTVHFDQCQLRYTSFVGRRMAGTRFVECALVEADFTDADLSGAVFGDCELAGAVFEHTKLVGADFTTARGFTLDPERNTLTRARFALGGLPGLLLKYGVIVE